MNRESVIELLFAALAAELEEDDDDKPDWHWHVCPVPACAHIWYHDRQAIPRGEGEYDKAHTCPACKAGKQRIKMNSQDEADKFAVRVRKGERP